MRRLLSLLVLAGLLASCSGPAAPQPSPGAPQPGSTPGASGDTATISFAVWDYERPAYEPLAERFMSEHPGINVVLVSLDDIMSDPRAQGPESSTALLRRVVSAADTAPAIGMTTEAFGSPLLLDLRPLMEADPNFRREEFYPGALERWSAQGGTWALPRYFYLQILNYNRDLFTLANLPEPEAGWTWEDLLAAAEQIRASAGLGQTYGYLDQSGGFQPLASLLKAEGLDLATTSAGELRLDDPRISATMERLRELFKKGVLYQPYTADRPNPEDPGQTVAEGRIAIWGDVYIPGPNGEPTQPEGIDIGRVPYPADNVDPWGGLNGEAFIISGGTSYPNESWKWIEWLSRQEIQQPGAQGMSMPANPPGRIPARESVAELSGFWQSIDEETAAAYRWALANPAPYPEKTPDYLTIGAISQAINAVVTNPDTTVQQALADAQRWLDETYAQQNLTPTPEPDLSPVLVATPEPQVAPEGATTITFAVPGFSPSEIRRIARRFREEHPDIFVQVKTVDFIEGPPQIADVAGSADCFTWTQSSLGADEIAHLLDLQPLLDSDTSGDGSTPLRDDFPPAVLEAFRRDGKTYGLPYAFNLRTLTYNRTAFDAAGIETPDGSWSVQDFLAAAQALTHGEGDSKQYGYVALNGAPTDLLFFIGQFGGRLTTGSGQDLRPNFTDPKTVEAIQWYIDLSKTHGVMPPLRLYYKRNDPGFEDKSFEIVQSGRAGMWLDTGYGIFSREGPRPISALSEPAFPGQERTFEVGVAPLPVGNNGLRSGDFYARGVHIAAGTEHPEACWEWLKFLTTDTSIVYGDYPARISVAKGEAYRAQSTPERLEVYDAYEEVLARPGAPGDDPYVLYGGQMDPYWFFKALDETVEKDADLAIGLEEAQRLTAAYLECVAGGEKPATCATQVDPTYQGFNVEETSPFPRG